MIWEINNYQELLRKNVAEGDRIEIPYQGSFIEAKVHKTYFAPYTGSEAPWISIMPFNRDKFADECYGYKNLRPGVSGFPDYKEDDYAAASRYLYRLFEYFESLIYTKPDIILELTNINL